MGKRQKWSWKCLGATAALLALTASFFGCGSDDDDDDDVAVKNVTLSATELSVVKDKENELIATIEPDNASAKTVTWYIGSTEDDLGTKVTVTTNDVEKPNDGSAEGLAISARLKSENRNRLIITGGAEAGKTVTVTAVAGGQKATCAVTVVAEKTLGTVAIAAVNSKNSVITAGSQVENTGTYTLTATVTGNSVTPTYKWESTGEAQEVKQDENNPAKATLTISEADAERTVTVKLTISAEGLTDKTAEFTLKPVAKGGTVTYSKTVAIAGDTAVVVGDNNTVTTTYTANEGGNANVTKYEWKAEPSDGVTIVPSNGGKAAAVTFTNATTAATTVNLTVTLTTEEGLNGGTNTTVTSTAFPVKVQPAGTVSIGTITITPKGDTTTATDGNGSVTLTASATASNGKTVTYTWEITDGTEFAGLDPTTGATVKLTGKNTTTEAKNVTVKVTATEAESKASNSTTYNVTIAAKTATSTKVPTIGELEVNVVEGTNKSDTTAGTITVKAKQKALAIESETIAPVAENDIAYTYALETAVDGVTIDETTGKLTNTNTAEKTVKVIATAKAEGASDKPSSATEITVPGKVEALAITTKPVIASIAALSTPDAEQTLRLATEAKANKDDVTVAYSWDIDGDKEYATLEQSSDGKTATLTGKNTTNKDKTVTVTVTATASTEKATSETVTITIPATTVGKTTISGATDGGNVDYNKLLSLTADATGNWKDKSKISYSWTVATTTSNGTAVTGVDAATLNKNSGKEVTLQVNNTSTEDTQVVTVTVTATLGDVKQEESIIVKPQKQGETGLYTITKLEIAATSPEGATSALAGDTVKFKVTPKGAEGTDVASIKTYNWTTNAGTFDDTTSPTPTLTMPATNTTVKVSVEVTTDDTLSNVDKAGNTVTNTMKSDEYSIEVKIKPKVSSITVTSVISKDDISVAVDTTNAKKLTATAPSGITVATWAWYVDGIVQENATTSSLDLSSSNLSAGYHYVTVTATTAAGVTYSATTVKAE